MFSATCRMNNIFLNHKNSIKIIKYIQLYKMLFKWQCDEQIMAISTVIVAYQFNRIPFLMSTITTTTNNMHSHLENKQEKKQMNGKTNIYE